MALVGASGIWSCTPLKPPWPLFAYGTCKTEHRGIPSGWTGSPDVETHFIWATFKIQTRRRQDEDFVFILFNGSDIHPPEDIRGRSAARSHVAIKESMCSTLSFVMSCLIHWFIILSPVDQCVFVHTFVFPCFKGSFIYSLQGNTFIWLLGNTASNKYVFKKCKKHEWNSYQRKS